MGRDFFKEMKKMADATGLTKLAKAYVKNTGLDVLAGAAKNYVKESGLDKLPGKIKETFIGDGNYENQSRDEIKEDLWKEFKRVEKENGGAGYRDDQEIWEGAIRVIDRYINRMKNAEAIRVDNEKFGIVDGEAQLIRSENLYKDKAIKYFKSVKKELERKYEESEGMKLITHNKELINDLACEIDTAENEALDMIECKLNQMQQDTNMKERSTVRYGKDGKIKTKINTDTGELEIDRQKPIFEQNTDTGVLTFTDRSNPLKIHKALNGLFPAGKHYKYKIDYSGCKNEKIKKKVMQLTGTGQCWITYDETAKTYLLRDKNGNPIKSRALIWDGVTLLRDGIDTWNKHEEEEKRKENIGKIDAKIESNVTPENDPALKEMVKDIPDSLKNKLKARGNHEYRRFIIETERRLGEILRYGKRHGYELHTEPVTKLRSSSGLMEVHFINGNAESDVTVWENDKVLGKGLYNLLDGNEGEYSTYLTARIEKLWGGKFQELTIKDDKVDVKPNYDLQESEKLPAETAGTIITGITMLKKFIENHRESEGDSRADNDDRYLVTMVQELRNLEYTIMKRQDNTKKEDMEAAIEKSIYKLHECWQSYWGYGKYSDPAKDPEWGKIKKALYGPTKQDQIQAIRSMAEGKRIFGDVTESSFLADEISTDGDTVKTNKAVIDPETGEAILDEDGNPVMETTVQGGLEVNDSVINAKFQNINKLLYTDLVYNDNNEIASSLMQRKIIDQLYTASSDTSGEQIISVLISNNMLPEGWRNDSDVKEKAKNIAESLRQKKAAAESLSLNDIKANEKKEKTELELKHNKTEEDFQRLQALEYLEAHPDEANKIHEVSLKKMQDEIKYGEINNLVRSSLASVFVDKGGGAKGKNADIYNDIVGYGLWDLSDENAKIAGEILVEIIITVVISVCTMGAGTLIVAGALRGASMLARSVRWVKLANNIQKAIRIMKLGTKGFKVANRTGKATQVLGKGTALLIEGTTFNAASNMIHSVTKGTSLDSLNLNPIAKENLQTAAFLGTLSLGNKIGMKVLTKLHGTTKIQAFSQAGLKEVLKNHKGIWTKSLVSEATAMFGAEQGINFVFGHDVINSETGEIETSRSFQRPTTQEWTQMIGMILAFKAVKPQLWHKYEQKLNNGTLEICRGVKKNEILIRNPKTGEVENIQDLIDGKQSKTQDVVDKTKDQKRKKRQKREEDKDKSLDDKEIIEPELDEEIIEPELDENLTSEQMEKIKTIQELGIDMDNYDINLVKDLAQDKIENIKENIKVLKELGIDIYAGNIDIVKDLTPDQIKNIKALKELGIDIHGGNIDIVKDLTPDQIKNNIKTLINFGLDTEKLDLECVMKLKEQDIQKLKIIKNFGLDMEKLDLEWVMELKEQDIRKLKFLKNFYGADLIIDDGCICIENGWTGGISKFLQLGDAEVNNLRWLENELGKDAFGRLVKGTGPQELIEISRSLPELYLSKDNIREYSERKERFLNKNRTLSDKDFDSLFKDKNSNSKYGMSEISQKALGYCYAYSSFELLRRSNFFDVLIKTSVKKTKKGFEVKLPLGDPNGHVIKVKKSEIDKKYNFENFDKDLPPEDRRGEISINSVTSEGFKVLEIAFIKEFILSNSKYEDNIFAQKARHEFETTGDITLNAELVHMVEGGIPNEFFKHMFKSDLVTTIMTNKSEIEDLLIKYNNKGNLKIGLGKYKDELCQSFSKEKGIWEVKKLPGGHAYSIEKVYHHPKFGDMVTVINPRDTAELKYDIKLQDCKDLFESFYGIGININNIFT